jgi:hypothetical protein
MGLSLSSKQMPDVPPTAGFLNDKPLDLPPHPRRDDPIDEDSDRIRLRAKILRAGGEWDQSCEDWLIGVVRGHQDREVRRDAIVSLRRLATPKVRAFFLDLLNSELNENTRELIIRSFALVGIAEDLPTMESMARDERSRFCRDAAIVATHQIRYRTMSANADITGEAVAPTASDAAKTSL